MIVQYVGEPVLIQRILIGFQTILERILTGDVNFAVIHIFINNFSYSLAYNLKLLDILVRVGKNRDFGKKNPRTSKSPDFIGLIREKLVFSYERGINELRRLLGSTDYY